MSENTRKPTTKSSSTQTHEYGRKFDKDVYDKSYFEGTGDKSGYTSYTDAKGIVTDQFHIIDDVMSGVGRLSHLDVGCAYGFGVGAMAKRGWTSSGVDVSEYAIGRAKELNPGLKFYVSDVTKSTFWNKKEPKQYKLVTGVEFFEHIDTADVPALLEKLRDYAEWGVFVVNARTNPNQDVDSSHGDHGHLNNHTMTWWLNEFGKVGTMDYDKMLDMNIKFKAYNEGVHWHNRTVVIKFNEGKEEA